MRVSPDMYIFLKRGGSPFSRETTFIKKDMLSEKTRTLLGYVPSAVFPALIFPAVLLDNSASFVSYNDPKIIAILIAMLVGFFSRKIIATILSGLISYWVIIFLL